MRRLYILVPLHRSVRRVARIRKDGRCRKPARHRKKVTLVVQLVEPIERNQPFRERTLLHLLTAAFFCDGFRMAAPSLGSQHARWLPGRRSKAASEGNRGRVGTPISGRYGDFAGADGAAEVLEAGVGGKWFGRAGASEGMRGDFVEMAGRLRGRWRAKAAKRTCAVVAGRRQR
jgi:hypothetical protein